MKKLHYWFLLSTIPLMVGGCNHEDNSNSTSNVDNNSSTNTSDNNVFSEDMYYEEEELNTYFHSDVSNYKTNVEEIQNTFKSTYADESINMDNITYAELYLNGKKEDNLKHVLSNDDDAYYHFYGNNKVRVVSKANGYCLTLPSTTIIEPNLLFTEYRTQYSTKDYVLTVTMEHSNPYNNWKTYHDEWLTRYLVSDHTELGDALIQRFLTNNQLSYTRDSVITTNILNGYEVELISILIGENENIEMPYYNIAIIRKPNDIKNFTLMVMKSKDNMNSQFDSIISSYKVLPAEYCIGKCKKPDKFDLKVPRYLSEETQKYYKKLMEQEYTEWGIFIHSMYENGGNVSRIKSKTEAFESEEQMNYQFDIMPTYTHCGSAASPNPFPLEEARELAGGNGFNGKPVLQFTMQFTNSNNLSLHDYTPMYDILRGKYDAYFKSLAQDIKAYERPVLFRLNNEMNSDWVSYCGQVTLLDPDIFQMTWERMAKIFEEEGCNNVLFIFNPTARSYPYSSWGEDLCYLPSLKYVQILGLTYYEYNNYFDEDPMSFFDMYQWLYEKNSPWVDYPAIISEFACGAGGNYPEGKLYRNHITQAVWVEEMLDFLNNYRQQFPFIQQIKGAIWFNANDDVGAKTKNLLIIDPENTPKTIAAFKEGLAQTKKIKGE